MNMEAIKIKSIVSGCNNSENYHNPHIRIKSTIQTQLIGAFPLSGHLRCLLDCCTHNPSVPPSRPITSLVEADFNMPAAAPMKPLPGTKYGPALVAVASCKYEFCIRHTKYLFLRDPSCRIRRRPAAISCLHLPKKAEYSTQLRIVKSDS